MDKENYLTVTALTKYIKRKFEVDPYLGRIYLVGEISNLRIRPHAPVSYTHLTLPTTERV